MKKNMSFKASLLFIALFNSISYCSKPDQKTAAEGSAVLDQSACYPHFKFMIDIMVKIGSIRHPNDSLLKRFSSVQKNFNALAGNIDFKEFDDVFNPQISAKLYDDKKVEGLFKTLDPYLVNLDPEMPAILEAERHMQQQMQKTQIDLAQENASLKEELKKLQEKIAKETVALNSK